MGVYTIFRDLASEKADGGSACKPTMSSTITHMFVVKLVLGSR